MIDLNRDLRLYLIAGPENVDGDFVSAVASAIRGGVTMFQLRAKHLTDRELASLAIVTKQVCDSFSIPFIVNDRIDIALACGASGVHLGVDDLPLEAARQLAGPDFVIGYSPETDDQLVEAKSRGANYLGIGPVFGTATKSDAGDALGLQEFHRRMELGNLPAVGIGGITASNSASVLQAGATGIAVVSAILGGSDPESVANQLSLNS